MSVPAWLTARPIAHRGLHDAARGVHENTVSAALAAVAAGFAIECDVQDTADGEAVVFHDHDLDRLTSGAGPVRSLAAASVSALAVRGGDDLVPTLETFLDRVGGRVPVIVEVKSRFDDDLALVRRTLDVVRRYGGPLAVKSFDPAVVAEVGRRAPDVPRGIVAEARYVHPSWDGLSPETKRRLANLLHWPETRPQFISWHVADLPHAAPFLARTLAGVPVMTWTVRRPDELPLARAHADQIVFEGFRPD